MKISTASAAVSLSRELETKSAAIYEAMAAKDAANRGLFLGFAKENRRFITDVERAYYGVITDALEGCFSFDLEADTYALPANSGDSRQTAAAMEEVIVKYYSEAAECSRGLMADVPRMFDLIAKKRAKRIALLK